MAAAADDAQALHALEKLCRCYWHPLYSYIRRQGYSAHDAQDCTQGFFARLLRANSLSTVDRSKGKFRTFLLTSLNHFLSDERDRDRAGKRGGGEVPIRLDETEAELRYQSIPSTNQPPEAVFDQGWALTLMEAALKRLRAEYESSGRASFFEHLHQFLSREGDGKSYAELAKVLGLSESALPVAVHRMRQRYRNCIRLELVQTVSTPGELEEEMRYLFSAILQSKL